MTKIYLLYRLSTRSSKKYSTVLFFCVELETNNVLRKKKDGYNVWMLYQQVWWTQPTNYGLFNWKRWLEKLYLQHRQSGSHDGSCNKNGDWTRSDRGIRSCRNAVDSTTYSVSGSQSYTVLTHIEDHVCTSKHRITDKVQIRARWGTSWGWSNAKDALGRLARRVTV